MQRRSGAALSIAAAAAFLTLCSGIAAAAQSSDEAHLFAAVNGERSSRSLAVFADASDLDALARKHSQEMAAAGEIYHSQDLADAVTGCWTTIGENVGSGPDVDSVHTAFMNSPEHRSNVLGEYNQVGLGVATATDGRVYVTETFAQRECTVHRKAERNVRAQARRTPPPSVRRAHFQPASSVVAAASQNVALLVRMLDLDEETIRRG